MGLIRLLTTFVVLGLLLNGCVSVRLESPEKGTPAKNQVSSTAAGVTKSEQWRQTSVADFQTGTHSKTKVTDVGDGAVILEDGAREGTFTSSVKQTDFPFNAIGLIQSSQLPKGAGLEIEVRTSQNGKDWSDWVPVHARTPSKDEKDDAEFQVIAVRPGSFIQYRALLSTSGETPVLEDITITYINSSQGPNMADAKNVTLPKAAGQPTIISREGWGANERYRFDASGKEIWPAEYREPKKLVIHHTLTPNDEDNYPAIVRAIYYYHAVTLEWGDIGYHYLIDPAGNIYEGRRGDGVVAGHAYGHNYGSIGIAVLGNYLTADVTDATRRSLVDLLAWLSSKYGIDPRGHSFFVDRDLPNIFGHRDSNQTTCPGTNLYAVIPNLRKLTFDKLPGPAVKIDNPSDGASIQTVQIVKLKQTDKWPITKVDFLVDDKPAATVKAPDWTWKLDPAEYSQGSHTLKAVVTNVLGKQTVVAQSFTVSAPPVSTWYFAEGNNNPGFQTLLLLMNPNTSPAKVFVTLYDEAGEVHRAELQVAPKSRANLPITQSLVRSAFGIRVDSDKHIYAERAMYFGHDGHTSAGVANLSKTWYFAEGSTEPSFETWLLVTNPNDYPGKLSVTYFSREGRVITKAYNIGATSRLNIYVNKDNPGTAVSIKIDSDVPVVAERSMYFDHDRGGHNTVGATAPSETWYFAEGANSADSNTWFLLFNPNSDPARVNLSFLQENGQIGTASYTVPPTSRMTIWGNTVIPNGSFATKIQSDKPIVAERSMYWAGSRAGHNTIGAAAPANQWYLPEGSTGGFNEWILLMNPNADPANVTLTFIDDKSNAVVKSHSVPGNSRLNVWVNQVMSSYAISTVVQSDRPIVVERSSYSLDNLAGTNSMGIPR